MRITEVGPQCDQTQLAQVEPFEDKNLTMTMRYHIATFFAALLSLTACSSAGPTEISYESTPPGIAAGYVSVTPSSSGLVVTNQTERPVYYFAIERGAAAYTDWAPCYMVSNCTDGIAQGATVTIPWWRVAGYRAEAREYLLYWYHVETDNGKQSATGMQNVVVRR